MNRNRSNQVKLQAPKIVWARKMKIRLDNVYLPECWTDVNQKRVSTEARSTQNWRSTWMALLVIFFYLIISKLLGSCWIQHISRSLIRIPKSPVFIDLILKFHAFLCILAYTHRPQRSRGLPWEPPLQTASLVICNPSFSAWQLQAAQLGEAARVKSQSPNCCL